MRGKLITIEGGDGVGKSTQIALLKEALARQGADALFVREPGDTQIGEKLRQIILDPQNEQMCWATEAMLYAAARVQLVTEKIVPALAEGRLVICDRYVDSSVAYQGFGRELGADYVTAGHVFDTSCKAGLPGRGLDFLRAVCAAVSIPVYAIGGVEGDKLSQIRAAGAAGACLMSGLMTCADPAGAVKALRAALEET